MSADTAADRAALAEAARHAAEGRYDEARRALEALGGAGGDDVAVLDLLARVHAQQGDLAAADECWARVERLDGEHAGAREGRRRIRRIWSRRPRGTRRAGIAAAAVLLVGSSAAAGWLLTAEPEERPSDREVLDELDRLGEEVSALGVEDEEPRTTAPSEPTLREIEAALDDPQWNVGVDGGSVAVTFAEPLFLAGGAEPSGSGEETLAAVAELVGGLDAVSVTVVGHTDDVPVGSGDRYADNVELGLARALAAARAVAEGGDIPLNAIAVASSGDADPPHSNATTDGRARNRTVTLLISPR